MRTLSTLALAGLFGGLLLVGDASACHKKKAACAPVACAPAPVVCEAPVKQKHHMKMPKLGCHKNKATAVCATYAPIEYASPAPAPAYATGQASGQGM